MRIIMIISSLILVVGTHAMQNDKNLLNLSIIKCIRPTNTIGYQAMLEKARETFSETEIKNGTVIFQLVVFDEITRQRVSRLKSSNRANKMRLLSKVIFFCPSTLLKDFQENKMETLGDKRFVCNQKIIDSMSFEEKIAPFDCALQKEEF